MLCFGYIFVNILYKGAEKKNNSFLNRCYTCIAGIVTRLLDEQPRSNGSVFGRVKKFWCSHKLSRPYPGPFFTMCICQASRLKMRELYSYLYPVTPYSFVEYTGTDLSVEGTYNNNLQQISTIDI